MGKFTARLAVVVALVLAVHTSGPSAETKKDAPSDEKIQQLIKLVRPYYSRAEWKKMRMPKTRHLIYHDYSVGDLTLLRDALAANLAAHR